MNYKFFFTNKLLSKTILNDDVIEIIMNKLLENEYKASNPSYLLSKKITFGKYKDKSISYILRRNPRYLLWVVNNNINPHRNITKELNNFIYSRVKKYDNNKKNNIKSKLLVYD